MSSAPPLAPVSRPAPFKAVYPWHLRGEHSLMGVAVAIAHLAAAGAAVQAWRAVGSVLWLGIAIIFTALSIDRSWGALTRIAGAARRLLRTHENYWPRRRPIQAMASVAVVFISGMAIGAGLSPATHRSVRIAWFATIGALAFVALRSLSLHEFDGLLYRHKRLLPRLPIGFIIEILAATIVLLAAGLQ